MKTILLILLLNTASLFGAKSFAAYDVEHTLLGKIAEAYVTKDIHDNLYTIELTIVTTGMAASFSDHLKKHFISQGSIENGVFIPDVLTVMQKKDTGEKFTTYRFEHQQKALVIDKSEILVIIDRTFNPHSFTFDESRRLKHTHESHPTGNYVHDDVITLFFNAKSYIKAVKKREEITFTAAGIDDEEDGISAFGISQKDIRDLTNTSLHRCDLLLVTLSDKIFKDTDKFLLIDINSDTLPHSVKLDDVAFGDVLIERVYENVAWTEPARIQI